mgnify:CR=1 FL=1
MMMISIITIIIIIIKIIIIIIVIVAITITIVSDYGFCRFRLPLLLLLGSSERPGEKRQLAKFRTVFLLFAFGRYFRRFFAAAARFELGL